MAYAHQALISNWGSFLSMREAHMEGTLKHTLRELYQSFGAIPKNINPSHYSQPVEVALIDTIRKNLDSKSKRERLSLTADMLGEGVILCTRKYIYGQVADLCDQTEMNEGQKKEVLQFFKWGYSSGKSQAIQGLVMGDVLPPEAIDKNIKADAASLKWD